MTDESRLFPCDVCGATETVEVAHSREFHQGQPIDICCRCGFVYVKRRRLSERIAEVWSTEIFGHAYTAAIPAVRARLTYVAEFVASSVGLRGKSVCEIGAGEGHGLELLREPRYGASVFGIEPSPANCARLRASGIDCYEGTIEEYVAAEPREHRRFDVVTIQWTLENCEDCRAMLRGAHQTLGPDGVVVVATGSRILVPFKKPLHTYFGQFPADTHAFRFSANTLQALLTLNGFDVASINRYLDHDVLCVIARKRNPGAPVPDWKGDSYLDVYSFFERWYADTKVYFPQQDA